MPDRIHYSLIAGFAVWQLVVSFFLIRLIVHYRKLTQNTNKKDLMNSLNQLIEGTKTNREAIETVKEQLKTINLKSLRFLQKIGFKRFNPFADTGGDQSFVLSLLDANLNGVVISSLHSRENTRIYAKAIKNGKPINQILSKEEAAVLLSQKTK